MINCHDGLMVKEQLHQHRELPHKVCAEVLKAAILVACNQLVDLLILFKELI
jgi:hypothetical protein